MIPLNAQQLKVLPSAILFGNKLALCVDNGRHSIEFLEELEFKLWTVGGNL